MLIFLIQLSTLAVAVSGLVSLMFGNWEKFGLKYAGVVLSTLAAFLMVAMQSLHPVFSSYFNDDVVKLDYALCYFTRNAALLIFHIAAGRDAAGFKQRDRRRGMYHGLIR